MVLRALCTAIGGCPGEVPFSVSVGPCSDAVLMPGSTLPAPRDGPRSAAEGGRDLSVCSTPVVVPEGDQLVLCGVAPNAKPNAPSCCLLRTYPLLPVREP